MVSYEMELITFHKTLFLFDDILRAQKGVLNWRFLPINILSDNAKWGR